MTAEPSPHEADHNPPDEGEELRRAVQRYKDRREKWRQEGEWSFAQTLAMMRSLGWMIVLPTVLGVFIGRWLDSLMGSGILWTAGLLVAGLVAGCCMAWKKLD